MKYIKSIPNTLGGYHSSYHAVLAAYVFHIPMEGKYQFYLATVNSKVSIVKIDT